MNFLMKAGFDQSLRSNGVLLPVALILCGIAIGLSIEMFALAKLRRRKRYRGVAGALQGMTVLLFTILGIYEAIHVMPMTTELLSLLRTVLHITLMVAGTIILTRFLAGLISAWSKTAETALASVSIVTTAVQFGAYVVCGLVIVHSFGFSLTPMLTALGAGGFAVALGLQNTLSNLFAGLHIIASKKIRPGDYIKLDSGQEGYVVDVTWRETTIKMLVDNVVIIPNAKLAGAIVTNYSLPEKELTVMTEVGVSYGSDLTKVEYITVEVAENLMREIADGPSQFQPYIRYHSFGDSSILFTVVMRVNEFVDQYRVRHELIKRLSERYEREGIIIPFPSRTVYLKTAEEKRGPLLSQLSSLGMDRYIKTGD